MSFTAWWILIDSIVTFAVYGYDKKCARRSRWRISERTLLGLAFLGGTPGALAGMFFFHHKTKKGSFLLKFAIVVLAQIGIIYLINRL